MSRPFYKQPLMWVLIVGVFGAGFLLAKSTVHPVAADDTAKLAAKYPHLARQALRESTNDTLINFVPLRKALQTKFATLTAPHSFSFEYLPTGTTIRIGDDQELVGASLIKLPVVMDLYRAAELGQIDLGETRTITEDTLNSQFGDLYKRGVGAKITLREAAKYALSKSDNTAILVIQKRLRDAKLESNALDAVDADYDAQADQVLINSKSYSSVLKCLYYACYINRNHSEELLSYLTESDFDSGIAKPIPDGTQIAHKIGTQYNKLTQSDCGIVYASKRPYLLCMMVGLPQAEANEFMAEVSDMIHDSVIKHQ